MDPQEGVPGEEDPVGSRNLPGSLSPPDDRPQVLAPGVEDTDLAGLLVQDVDGTVAGDLDAPDSAEYEVQVLSVDGTEPQVHLCFGDFRNGVVDGREVGVSHQECAVREGLAEGGRPGGFRDAGGRGGNDDECEQCARHGFVTS